MLCSSTLLAPWLYLLGEPNQTAVDNIWSINKKIWRNCFKWEIFFFSLYFPFFFFFKLCGCRIKFWQTYKPCTNLSETGEIADTRSGLTTTSWEFKKFNCLGGFCQKVLFLGNPWKFFDLFQPIMLSVDRIEFLETVLISCKLA